MKTDEAQLQELIHQLSISGSYQAPRLADELLARIRERERPETEPELVERAPPTTPAIRPVKH
jgi:hypothetical protein